MPTTTRLRRSADVRAVFGTRETAHGALLVVHWRDRGDDGPARAAVVAGRRVGGAVDRNRAKRRLRGALTSVSLDGGNDYVVVARRALLRAPGAAVREELGALAGRRRGGASR